MGEDLGKSVILRIMNAASKLDPHTHTDRGTCPGIGLSLLQSHHNTWGFNRIRAQPLCSGPWPGCCPRPRFGSRGTLSWCQGRCPELGLTVAIRLSANSEHRGGRQSGGERLRPKGLSTLETPVSFSPISGVEREPKADLNLNCNGRSSAPKYAAPRWCIRSSSSCDCARGRETAGGES
jgi:hypothetical protein